MKYEEVNERMRLSCQRRRFAIFKLNRREDETLRLVDDFVKSVLKPFSSDDFHNKREITLRSFNLTVRRKLTDRRRLRKLYLCMLVVVTVTSRRLRNLKMYQKYSYRYMIL